jgi:2-dehydropantoate 2-reductase
MWSSLRAASISRPCAQTVCEWRGDRGETVPRPVEATDDPAAIGPVDLVLLCVKLWDVETAGEQILPLIGSETAAIPLQNGIDASERLSPILGAAHVLGASRG